MEKSSKNSEGSQIFVNEFPLNVMGESEGGYLEEGRQLFIMMSDDAFQNCLYRVRDPCLEDETSVRSLGEPLLKMDKSTYPEFMNFAAIGPRIFMVGGSSNDVDDIDCPSKKVFIYDTLLLHVEPGPPLNSGKYFPHLLSLGSKLFALSGLIYCCDPDNDELDPKPRFEMLDTDNLALGWCVLPVPRLHVYKEQYVYSVEALAAVNIGSDGNSSSIDVIFISVSDAGTYAFQVEKRVWNHVSDEALPFSGQAISIPHAPYLCCAHSLKSKKFSAFHFSYESDGFLVSEIKFDDSYDDNPCPLWPTLECRRPSLSVFGPNGRVYIVMSGVDEAETYKSPAGNRYVHVYSLEFANPKGGFTVGNSLKRCGNLKAHIGHAKETTKVYSGKGQLLKRCKNKKQMEHGEEQDKIVEDDLTEEQMSKRFRKKKMKLLMRLGEENTKELKLSNIWKTCFFGGPVCDPMVHVAAAFSM